MGKSTGIFQYSRPAAAQDLYQSLRAAVGRILEGRNQNIKGVILSTITISKGAIISLDSPYTLVIQLPATEASTTEPAAAEVQGIKIVPSESDFDTSEEIHWNAGVAYLVPQRRKMRPEQEDITLDMWRFTSVNV